MSMALHFALLLSVLVIAFLGRRKLLFAAVLSFVVIGHLFPRFTKTTLGRLLTAGRTG